jgi:hypothetical protein
MGGKVVSARGRAVAVRDADMRACNGFAHHHGHAGSRSGLKTLGTAVAENTG